MVAEEFPPRRPATEAPNLRVHRDDIDALEVWTNFLVVRTMQDGAMAVFAVGRYVDSVVHGVAGWQPCHAKYPRPIRQMIPRYCADE